MKTYKLINSFNTTITSPHYHAHEKITIIIETVKICRTSATIRQKDESINQTWVLMPEQKKGNPALKNIEPKYNCNWENDRWSELKCNCEVISRLNRHKMNQQL